MNTKPLTREEILSDVQNAIKKIDTHMCRTYEYVVISDEKLYNFETYQDAINSFCALAGDASLYRVCASKQTLLKEKVTKNG